MNRIRGRGVNTAKRSETLLKELHAYILSVLATDGGAFMAEDAIFCGGFNIVGSYVARIKCAIRKKSLFHV
ncbi:hypothetical protein KIN20_027626 [Parelaphostrongylus tenuis]|uniref:Uncharacterized protein n=1 Tax=Parelaphostrongylus tenuis TaxID=148309 RepID=A0AAD5WE37_PARTN|nr:hypothetical protein KIN20_027626 [Parelaphostrongylus tenuis]